MSANGTPIQHHAMIGNDSNFWLYSSETGFDLTHPDHPSSAPIDPSVRIQTSTQPITIDPAKSALVIIDMQNYFLSEALNRSRGTGHAAADQLVQHAIPACRKAGIRILWVNWGLTEQEVEEMPPAIKRAFGFEAVIGKGEEAGFGVDKHGTIKDRAHKGIGSEIGIITDPNTGEKIDGGRVLMRDSWNAALYLPLNEIYEEGRKLNEVPDVWIHKNRMSAMWGSDTLCEQYLKREGIKTLLFAGVNTDQCVGGTYQDCFSKGYDCIMLKDGCGTTSPGYAQQCMEWNAENTWGFVATCKQFAEGVASKK